ncbi:MAG: hypothetical protein QXV30_05700 [Desulfurococcaceae archaeon]
MNELAYSIDIALNVDLLIISSYGCCRRSIIAFPKAFRKRLILSGLNGL